MGGEGQAYLYVSLDEFFDMLPEVFHADIQAHILVGSGFNRAVAAMASAGNNLVVDTLFAVPEWRWEAARALRRIPRAYLVGVRCGLEEVERREGARGDRPAGQARAQFPVVHAGIEYDLEVDAGELNAHECAARIKAHVDSGARPRAFAWLRRDERSRMR